MDMAEIIQANPSYSSCTTLCIAFVVKHLENQDFLSKTHLFCDLRQVGPQNQLYLGGPITPFIGGEINTPVCYPFILTVIYRQNPQPNSAPLQGMLATGLPLLALPSMVLLKA